MTFNLYLVVKVVIAQEMERNAMKSKAAWSQREHKTVQHYLQEQRILQGRSSRRHQRLLEVLQSKLAVRSVVRNLPKKEGDSKAILFVSVLYKFIPRGLNQTSKPCSWEGKFSFLLQPCLYSHPTSWKNCRGRWPSKGAGVCWREDSFAKSPWSLMKGLPGKREDLFEFSLCPENTSW